MKNNTQKKEWQAPQIVDLDVNETSKGPWSTETTAAGSVDGPGS